MRDPLLRITRPRRWPRRLLVIVALLLSAVCLLPYGLPLSAAAPDTADLPYPNSLYLEADGIRLHSRIWQNANSACQAKILLIHGLGGSTYSWEQTAPALADAGFLTVAVDLPAFGFSSRQSGLDHAQGNRARLLWLLLDQIDARLESCGGQAGWILAGHSMGGGTAAAMALARPEQTERLILADGALFDSSNGISRVLLEFPPARRWLALLLEHRLITDTNIRRLLAATHGEAPTPARVSAYLVPLQISGTATALADMTRTARSEPVGALSGSGLRIDAIWGGRDTITPLEDARILQEIIPAMKLWIIQDAAHLPMETHASEFNQLLIDVLENND